MSDFIVNGKKYSADDIFKLLDEAAVPYQIVLTKTDKVSDAAVEKLKNDITFKLKTHAAAHTKILVTSSEKKVGLDDVRLEIFSFI